MFFFQRTGLADLEAKHRLPAMYGAGAHAAAGGLIAYSPSVRDLFRRAATYVDKILKGTKPADLPVEQHIMFDLIINLKTAKALGITFPESILLRADKIIMALRKSSSTAQSPEGRPRFTATLISSEDHGPRRG